MGFNLCQTCSFHDKLVLLFSKISCHFTMAMWQEPYAFKLHCGLFVQFLELQYAISYGIHERKWSAWGQALLSGPWILFQFEALQDSHSGLFTLFFGIMSLGRENHQQKQIKTVILRRLEKELGRSNLLIPRAHLLSLMVMMS